MSRTKPTLSNAASAFAAAEVFNPRPPVWKKIETAFGKPLRASARYLLSVVASSYISRRARELDPPLHTAAVAQVDAIEKAAVALEAALQAVTVDPVSFRLPGMFHAARSRADSHRDPECMEVNMAVMQRAAGSFARAALRVRLMLESDVENKPGSDAWKFLISDLRDFAEARGIKVSARKDTKTSQFPVFVMGLLVEFPERYRQHTQSLEALSKAISPVLKKRGVGTDKPG